MHLFFSSARAVGLFSSARAAEARPFFKRKERTQRFALKGEFRFPP